uniref:gametocyte-specific factor 1-like n=1 Tax=Euleptes europaea TaxID=460621 RepID=UPI0025401EFC|nr:gametocyte-specific factor 1-like [Euleptes europaea]
MGENYVDALDLEKLVQCLYDKNHQIRACRFPYHLIKCHKNHPDIVEQLVTCPFNALHQVPRAEVSQHISSCDDKRIIEQDIASQSGNYRKEPNVVSTWQSPPCKEDWDKDLGDQSVFIWDMSRCETNSSELSTTMGHKNHLCSGVQVPRSLLPWKSKAGN